MKRFFVLLFLTHFITRLLFTFIVGFDNNYGLQADSGWLVEFANEALRGNFNFELDRFIVSPLMPLTCAFFKLVFASYWDTAFVLFQVAIAALSGVYIYRIACLLFRNSRISMIASLVFGFYPMTLWYVHTFSQEILFQSLFIFTVYYLLLSLESGRNSDVIKAAVLFSLSFLTKSHILIFSLFIPLIYFHRFRLSNSFFIKSTLFAAISVLFTLPYGIYHKKIHDVYVLSSNGAGYQFYVGNTNGGYVTVVDVPSKNSDDFQKMKNINHTIGYFNGSETKYDSLLNLPQKIKQKDFYNEAITWIFDNPMKAVKLKVYNLFFFLFPGVSFRHYTLVPWLFSFLVSFPVYISAYIVMLRQLKRGDPGRGTVFYIFLSMVIFSVVWYVQNRFRTVTIEPFYIVYAAPLFLAGMESTSVGRWLLARLSQFYKISAD